MPFPPTPALGELIKRINERGRLTTDLPRFAWDAYFQGFCTYFYNLGKNGEKQPERRVEEVMAVHRALRDKEEQR